MTENQQMFYMKIGFLVILIIALLYVLENKPELGTEVPTIIEETQPVSIEEEPAPAEPVEVVVPPTPIEVVTPPAPPQNLTLNTPEEPSEMEKLIVKYNLPEFITTDVEEIEEIDFDLLNVKKKADNNTFTFYAFVPSTKETTEITMGTFKLINQNKTYYFVNGLYYPYNEYQIFRINEEMSRLLGRNVNYRQSNSLDKIIYVCTLTNTSFMALIGTASSYDKAQLYFFDEGVDKVRFVSLGKDEAVDLGKGIECVS